MPHTHEFVVGPAQQGRLDRVIAAQTGLARARVVRLIADGAVLVDGDQASKSLSVRPGMRVRVIEPDPVGPPVGEAIEVKVVHEDPHLMVIAKPAGLVTHPAPGHTGGTLVNALLARSEPPAGGASERPGIVHRLDVGTSGLMVIAKSEEAHGLLVEAMSERRIERTYLALIEGGLDTDTATVDAPIGRSARHRKKMAIVAGGKPAVTRFTVLERHRDTSLVEAKPETGRTHQIRVHLQAAGHPVVGDPVYGKDRKLARALGLRRPFLHATRLSFRHPITGEQLDLTEPLPAELIEALARARAGTAE